MPCHRAYMEAWHAKNDHRKTTRRPGKCSKCGADKPKGTTCKPCYNAWQREYLRKKHGWPGKGVCRTCGGPSSRQSPCKPCRNEYLRDWNKQAEYAAQKAWKDRNPDAVRAHSHLRRARELGAEGYWTDADIAAIRKKQKGKCASCGVKLLRPPFKWRANDEVIDHRHPLARNGTNWPINLSLKQVGAPHGDWRPQLLRSELWLLTASP